MQSINIQPSNELLFAVIAIEETAKRFDVPVDSLVRRLSKTNLIEGRLWKFYEPLHSQSREYVADDLMQTLTRIENKES